ncbi:MAG TPA: MBL fold metallo-hydrolase [Acidimicrobiia bacterium]|jgi:ribonuclease Z
MEVVTLGTGSPLPDPARAGAATLVRAGGATLLFDCGRGVCMRLAAAGVLPTMVDALLLTHLHSDHTTDLNDMITTRWVMSPVESPFPVVGPPGTAALVDRTIAMLADDVRYRRDHHDDLDWPPSCTVAEVLDGTAWESEGVRVLAAPTDHRPVAPTVGYRVEEAGEGGTHAATLAGDTVPCAGLDRLCAGAAVYVQTVVRPDLVAAVPNPRFQDVLDYHSSCEDAGRTASKAGVTTLVLTHPVPPPAPGTDEEWVAQAAAHFDGEVVLAHDLWSITI